MGSKPSEGTMATRVVFIEEIFWYNPEEKNMGKMCQYCGSLGRETGEIYNVSKQDYYETVALIYICMKCRNEGNLGIPA